MHDFGKPWWGVAYVAYVPCITNFWALYAWVIRWHVTRMLSLAEHWQGRGALSNHVCAHSVISMWHVVCLQHLARACSEQSRPISVLPTWYRCRNAYRDLWIMTIAQSRAPPVSSAKYLFSTVFKRPWTVYVVRSKFVLICGQLLTRKTEISVCGIGVICAGFVCEGSIMASFSVSSLSKDPFREHRILGNELVCRYTNASHQRGYAVEWNSPKWQSRLSNPGVKPRVFDIESDGIYGNFFSTDICIKLHLDISSGFTFKVSGACALREQVSHFCNICVLSRQIDEASGSFHPEGATINSLWNDIKSHVNS